MKKVLLFTIGGLIGLQVSAQTIQEADQVMNQLPVELEDAMYNGSSSRSSVASPEAAGDTIWYEDFANGVPAGWVLSGANSANCPWVYSLDGSSGFFGGSYPAAAPGMNSATAANGFLLCDPDSANQALYGQPSGSMYQYLESYITSAPVDLTGEPSVRLEFEQSFRYNNTIDLEVSVSTDGTNWTTFDAKGGVGPNSASADPTTFSVDVSTLVGGSSTAYIRLGWSARVYFWMVDDIRFVVPPAHDLELSQEYYNTYSDSTFSSYYKMIPMRHANLDTVNFGAAFENKGSSASTNASVEVNVMYNGSNVYSQSSTGITSAVGAQDSVNITTPFFPSNGLGIYNVSFDLSADSADGSPTNNTITDYFEVSDNEYRRDNDTMSTGNWYNVTSDWEMLSLYKINTTDTATAVSCMFPYFTSVSRGVVAGDAISYYIYNDADLSVPVTKNEFYVVTAADEDGWITLPVPEVTLTPGYYYVGFKIYNDNSAVGSNTELNSKTAPLSVLVRTDAGSPTDPWSYTTSLTPFVRLYTKSPDACAGVSILVNDTVVDNQHFGSVNIGVTGGTPGYSYSWSGPNGFTSGTQNLSNLTTQGNYEVTVTDVFGCTGTHTSVVAGKVTVNELSLDNNVALFPNPNNGEYTLAMNGIEGTVTIAVKNVLGQVVSTETVNVNGSSNKMMNNSNLNKGIYFVEVSDENNAKTVIRFIVE